MCTDPVTYEAVTANEEESMLFAPKGPNTFEDVTKDAVEANEAVTVNVLLLALKVNAPEAVSVKSC